MLRFSIDVTGKIRSCLFVLSALLEQGPAVAKLVLAKALPSLGEGDEPPPFLAQIQALGLILKSALDRMVDLDRMLVDENDLRASLLKTRNDLAAKLAQRAGGLRRIIIGCYLAPEVAKLGLIGRFSREPIMLLRQSELVCKRLQGDGLEETLGKAMFDPPIDPRPYALQIEPDIEVVRQSVEAHNRSRRRVDQLLAEKKEAVQVYDVTFLRVTRQFEDLCRLAGKNDLADKVRPSVARPGQTEEEPADGAAPDATGGVDAAGEPEPATTDSESAA